MYANMCLVLCLLLLPVPGPTDLHADDGARRETRVEQVRNRFGLTGEGVIIAVLDRGIDYEHPDFRNEDGTSRILYLLDLSDDSGANDRDNPVGAGTLYTKAALDAALASGIRLPARDAVGHGTTTAGLAGGNGRASDGLYAGMAPEASFIIVKFTSEGAPAHDGEPAEMPFFRGDLLPDVLDFIIGKAEEVDLPFVALANFGSIQGPMDGTSTQARLIDARFGPGKPGRVFVTGTSDDGGSPNHAGGEIGAGETVDLQVRKGHDGNLRVDLWYDAADRLDVEIVTPSGTFGPYASPAGNGAADTRQEADFSYFHQGSDVDFFGAQNGKREILIDFGGPAGNYTIRLTGETVADGRFDAAIPNFGRPDNRFESFVDPGHTVWDWATALNNIAPNSYVLRHEWRDVDGNRRIVSNEGAIGDLWIKSGIGPTYDGRFGVTVSAPGERLFAPYAPRSNFARFRHNIVRDNGSGGMYGIQSAVSAAAPVTTGIIALLLQADPTLDAAEVKSLLQRTARQDAFTGAVPNNQWGYGKIDALAAVADLLGVAVNAPPTAAQITSPAPGSNLTVGGGPAEDPLDPATPFVVQWTASSDPEGEAVTYAWQLATASDFGSGTVLLEAGTGVAAQFETTLQALAALLDDAGIALDASITLFHRVTASDGSATTTGPTATLTLSRGTLVDVEDEATAPTAYALARAYPSPFKLHTRIGFSLPQATEVHLAVYDVLGRQVQVLLEGMQPAGRHEALFEAEGLPNGVYIYRLQAGAFTHTRRMLLVK